MAEGEEHKIAFQIHSGHYEYKVMPYGVTGGPATFQVVRNPLLRKCVVVFIDDIMIYSKTCTEHLDHIKVVLTLLQKHHFHIKLPKCSFVS
jgi:hypothetical protein